MIQRIYLIFVIALLAFLITLSCNSDSARIIDTGFDDEFDYSSYPTTIYSLPFSQLNSYLKEYAGLNNNSICTTLNQYGYCEYTLSTCMGQSILREEITDESRMISIAKSTIVLNKKFTGIENADELVISRSEGFRGCIKCDGSEDDFKTITWKIEYEPQIYDGLEVLDAELVVFLNNKGVRMLGGNWFHYVAIPPKDKIPFQDLKEVLKEHEVVIECAGNNDTVKVTLENIFPAARKVIFPFTLQSRIELRVAWEIFLIDSHGWKIWRMYVDSTTGEIISENQWILC